MDLNSIKAALGLISPEEHEALKQQAMDARVGKYRQGLPAALPDDALRTAPVQVMQRVPGQVEQPQAPALQQPVQPGGMTPSEYMDWKLRTMQGGQQ